MLTVTVDHPEGVQIDQYEQVSRALDPMLDEKVLLICRPIRCAAFPRRGCQDDSSGRSISRRLFVAIRSNSAFISL